MLRARVVLTIPAVVTLLVPPLMDSNHTHQLNESWPPHARYHGAVLVTVNVLAGLVSLWMLWGRRDTPDPARLRTAALLPALIWGSFFPALLAPGVSTWPDGIGHPEALPFAPNVIIAGVLVILCAVGARLARAP